MFYKFKASHDLAMKSVFSKKEARLKSAVKAYERFNRNYPESEYMKESNKLLDKINDQLADYSLLVVTP